MSFIILEPKSGITFIIILNKNKLQKILKLFLQNDKICRINVEFY